MHANAKKKSLGRYQNVRTDYPQGLGFDEEREGGILSLKTPLLKKFFSQQTHYFGSQKLCQMVWAQFQTCLIRIAKGQWLGKYIIKICRDDSDIQPGLRTTDYICYLSIFFVLRISYLFIFCIVWRRKWQPTPVFLPGKSHGPRSLELIRQRL